MISSRVLIPSRILRICLTDTDDLPTGTEDSLYRVNDELAVLCNTETVLLKIEY